MIKKYKPKPDWDKRYQNAYKLVRKELDEILTENPELKPNPYVISKAMDIAATYRANHRFEYSKKYLVHVFGLETSKQNKALENPDYIKKWNSFRRFMYKMSKMPD